MDPLTWEGGTRNILTDAHNPGERGAQWLGCGGRHFFGSPVPGCEHNGIITLTGSTQLGPKVPSPCAVVGKHPMAENGGTPHGCCFFLEMLARNKVSDTLQARKPGLDPHTIMPVPRPPTCLF